MTDDAFIAAVIEAPDDDALWLAYADWLEERGDPRGVYVRYQRERLAGKEPKRADLLEREAAWREEHAGVILPWLRRLCLSRIRKLLERVPTEWPAPYTAGPRLSEADLVAWETRNGVLLPEAYRTFLREIGNGGRMPGGYCDFEVWPLEEISLADTSLSEAFPVSRQRLRDRLAENLLAPTDGTLFPELDPYWDAARLPAGCLSVAMYPSYDGVLLVVTGELRGSIWCSSNRGVPEESRQGESFDFLSWFEDTLLEARTWNR